LRKEERAAALLAIVREVYEDGRAVMGPNWTLLPRMTALAQTSDVVGMVRYYRRCIGSRKGQRAHARLSQAGKRTLESEQTRFMSVARPFLWRQRLGALAVLLCLVLLVAALVRLLR
jgi:hypothetical protein